MSVAPAFEPKEPLITPIRVLASLFLAALVSSAVVAIANSQPGTPPTTGNAAIEARYPEPSALEFRQAKIGIDLTDNYVLASLAVDNTVVPDDELHHNTLNQTFFQALDGTTVGQLDAGRHCATATYYATTSTPDDTQTDTWCFIVH